MDPRLHLLMSLGMGLVLMSDRTKDVRKYALVGALGIVGLLPDADIFLFPGANVRPFESALFILGVPLGIFLAATTIERGGAETLRRRFGISCLAVLFGHIVMDAAKGHTPSILYPFSSQRFEFRFGDPEIPYSGLGPALLIVIAMAAAAYIANWSILTAREIGEKPVRRLSTGKDVFPTSIMGAPAAILPLAMVPLAVGTESRRKAVASVLARRRSVLSPLPARGAMTG